VSFNPPPPLSSPPSKKPRNCWTSQHKRHTNYYCFILSKQNIATQKASSLGFFNLSPPHLQMSASTERSICFTQPTSPGGRDWDTFEVAPSRTPGTVEAQDVTDIAFLPASRHLPRSGVYGQRGHCLASSKKPLSTPSTHPPVLDALRLLSTCRRENPVQKPIMTGGAGRERGAVPFLYYQGLQYCNHSPALPTAFFVFTV